MISNLKFRRMQYYEIEDNPKAANYYKSSFITNVSELHSLHQGECNLDEGCATSKRW